VTRTYHLDLNFRRFSSEEITGSRASSGTSRSQKSKMCHP